MMRRAFWNREKLKKHQNKRLRKIVKYAYENSLFYHDRFKKVGIYPSDIRTVSDLNKLPILRKDDVRKNLERMVSRKYKVANLKRLHTSGSTGKPLYFYITGSEDEFRKAKHLRANISCGQKPWDKWVLITSPVHFGETKRLQRLLGIYVPIPVLVFNDVATQVSLIEKLNPDILDGYSSSLFLPFYDQYACEEMERVAWQCKERNEYHIDADSIILQFVDDGEEVSPGESGEIVCTSLFNYATPFIRFAIEDVGIPSSEECPCGRTLPLMKVIEGRKDSFLMLSDGQVLSPISFDAAMVLFKFHDEIDQYRIIQRKTDLFEFLIKLDSDSLNERTVEEELLKHLRRTLNINADKATFKIKFVDEIPLDKTGKLRKVVSALGQTLD